jgi:hypothetical protein
MRGTQAFGLCASAGLLRPIADLEERAQARDGRFVGSTATCEPAHHARGDEEVETFETLASPALGLRPLQVFAGCRDELLA